MASFDTKTELFSHLDKITRGFGSAPVELYTTAKIAADCHVSRNLASQYLNEFVRQELAVKVNTRPVMYLHRRNIERFLQTKLDRFEFSSLQDLLATVNEEVDRDFDKAIGFELSYSTGIDQLKSAIQYPPHGIPAVLVGEHGTGKRLLSQLTFEYGINSKTLPPTSHYFSLDCSRYVDIEDLIEKDLFDKGGIVEKSGGGLIYLREFDRLSSSLRERIIQHFSEDIASPGAAAPTVTSANPAAQPLPRLFVGTSRPLQSEVVKTIARYVPIVVALPRLKDRSVEERMSLVMHYLRVEGRRVAADVSISRGALRALVEADFVDNIDGLRSSITTSCASAYLNRSDEMLIIHTYNLPAGVIGSTEPHPDDDQLIRCERKTSDPFSRVVELFQQIIDTHHSFEAGAISFGEFLAAASSSVDGYADFMNFENRGASPRVESYEQLIGPIVEDINKTYAVELTRMVTRSLAQSYSTQLWGSVSLTKWRQKNAAELRGIIATLSKNLPDTSMIVNQIATKCKTSLGVKPDELSTLILFIQVDACLQTGNGPRDYLGVIMCHGYSTATSIADAANRILRHRIFEAIDMTYEQEVTDVTGQLQSILGRFPNCHSIAILVDMGSLEQIGGSVYDLANCDVHIATNVSTALALEIGSALISHESLEAVFANAADTCSPKYRLVKSKKLKDAIVFCSEAGTESADRLRQLVYDSIPNNADVDFVTCDFTKLSREGSSSAVFDTHRVRAIVGTMDPGVVNVPFVGLEDILYEGSSDELDKALFNALGPEGIATFHSNLLRNVTLRNVIESITILNPEMLYVEADRAVSRLAELTGEKINARKRMALYVHLCGLIERLVTNNFVETYPNEKSFCVDHADFIWAFREAFVGMTERYHTKIPVSEIGYIYHMLHVPESGRGNATPFADVILEDE